MIRLTCTNCQAVLTMDDGFAGGVCRCLHCGTIQTVPAQLKGAVARSTKAQTVAPKALYKTKTATVTEGTGLEELAEIVSSSGLRQQSLRGRPSSVVPEDQQPQSFRPRPSTPPTTLFVGVAVAAVLVLLVVIAFYLGRSTSPAPINIIEPPPPSPTPTYVSPAPSTPMIPTAPPARTAPRVAEPSFCGVNLDVPSVIYILDRGASSFGPLPLMKLAALKSAETLGPGRTFQIMFWNNDAPEAIFPAVPALATAQNIRSAHTAIEDIYAKGASDISPVLRKAIARRPSAIVIVTGKGWALVDKDASAILSIRGSSSVKIHTFSVGSGDSSPPLQRVARSTGGQYREITEEQLRVFAGAPVDY